MKLTIKQNTRHRSYTGIIEWKTTRNIHERCLNVKRRQRNLYGGINSINRDKKHLDDVIGNTKTKKISIQ